MLMLVLKNGSTSFIPMSEGKKDGAAIQDAANEVDPIGRDNTVIGMTLTEAFKQGQINILWGLWHILSAWGSMTPLPQRHFKH